MEQTNQSQESSPGPTIADYNQELRKINFMYVAKYKVFACILCKVCYVPQQVWRHATASSMHSMDPIAGGLFKTYFIAILTHLKENKHPRPPAMNHRPIAWLAVHDGYVCRKDGMIKTGSNAYKNMQQHITQAHGKRYADENPPEAIKCQTFYHAQNKIKGKPDPERYFLVPDTEETVVSTGTALESDEVADSNLAKQASFRDKIVQESKDIIPKPATGSLNFRVDFHPLLEALSIRSDIMIGKPCDRQQYAKLCKWHPQEDLDVTNFVALCKTEFMENVVSSVRDLATQSLCISSIIKTQVWIGDETVKSKLPFVALEDSSLVKYCSTWTHLMVFLFRLADENAHDNSGIELHEDLLAQVTILKRLCGQTTKLNPNISASITRVMWQLITQDVFSRTSSSPVWHVSLCLMIESQNGSIKSAHQCSGLFAHLKYAFRAFFARHVHTLQQQGHKIEPKEIIKLHNLHLSTGSSATGIFSWLAACTSTAKHFADKQPMHVLIQTVKDNPNALMLHGIVFTTQDWSMMLKSAIEDMVSLLETELLFSPMTSFPPPSKFYDSTSNETPGFNLCGWQQNHEIEHEGRTFHGDSLWDVIIDKLCTTNATTDPKLHRLLSITFNSNPLHVDKSSLLAYGKHRKEFLHRLSLLLHLTSGMPSRGTELLSITLRNSNSSKRHIYVLNGQVTVITRYWKGRNLHGGERPIPRVPAWRVDHALLLYIMAVEPFERFLSTKEAGGDGQFIDSAFLLPLGKDPTQHFLTSRLSADLCTLTQCSLGVSINVQINRHIQKTWARRFLDIETQNLYAHLIDEEDEENEAPGLTRTGSSIVESEAQPIHRQMGHQPRTSARYGLHEKAGFSDQVEAFQRASNSVHLMYRLTKEQCAIETLDRPDIPNEIATMPAERSEVGAVAQLSEPSFVLGTPSSALTADSFSDLDLEESETTLITAPRMSPEKSSPKKRVVSAGFSRPGSQESPNKVHVRRRHLPKYNLPEYNLPEYIPPVATIDRTNSVREFLQGSNFISQVKSITRGSGQMKNNEQAQALRAVLMLEKYEKLLVVLPTGAGKTLLYLVQMPDAGCTVVIVPLVALLEQVEDRCRSIGIDYVRWSASSTWQTIQMLPMVILIGAEQALSPRFFDKAAELCQTGHIGRIVLDEAHIVLYNYRQELQQIHRLGILSAPTVFMTATMPVRSSLASFRKVCGLKDRLQVFHVPTNRPNIHIQILRTFSEGETDCTYRALKTSVAHYCSVMQSSSRGIIFWNSITHVEALASTIGSNFYHSKLPSRQRTAVMQDWLGRECKSRWIVTTSALECGIDYPEVRAVIHCGPKDDIISAVQEMGRAGRDGAPADFVIYQPAMGPFPVRDEFEEIFKETVCYRQCLNKIMDGIGETCTQQDRACQLCAKRYGTDGSILTSTVCWEQSRDAKGPGKPTPLHALEMPSKDMLLEDMLSGDMLLGDMLLEDLETLPVDIDIPARDSNQSTALVEGVRRSNSLLQAMQVNQSGHVLEQQQHALWKAKVLSAFKDLANQCTPCVVLYNGKREPWRHVLGSRSLCSHLEQPGYFESWFRAIKYKTGTCWICRVPQLELLCSTKFDSTQRKPLCAKLYTHMVDALLYGVYHDRQSEVFKKALSRLDIPSPDLDSQQAFMAWCVQQRRWPGPPFSNRDSEQANQGWFLTVALLEAAGLV